MGRKKKPEEHENHERWMVSYADFVTLLFAFFTSMYAISNVDAQKMGKMVTSMKSSFESNMFAAGSDRLTLNGGAGGTESSRQSLDKVTLQKGAASKDLTLQRIRDMNTLGVKGKLVSGEKAMGQLKRSMETLLGDEIAKGRVRAHLEPRGLVISLGEGGMFDSGSDQIKPEGKALLDTIATSLVALENQVRVEGHTDNVPIRNSKFPSNWELSTARATAMIAYLIAKFGLRQELISAAGYAEFRPAATNDTEEGRSTNRRVDIVVLNPGAAAAEAQ